MVTDQAPSLADSGSGSQAPSGSSIRAFSSRHVFAAFEQARAAAGGKDIAIADGADIVRQCLDAGLAEEGRLNLIPILLGSRTRLFEGVDSGRLQFELTSVIEGDGVVHLRFRVRQV